MEKEKEGEGGRGIEYSIVVGCFTCRCIGK